MAEKSQIEWTDATWNPATGCTKVSPGCAHCYIERTAPFRVNHWRFDEKGKTPIYLHHNRLTQPLRWKRPRRVFVNSLSDLFHEDIPNEFIDQVFAVMALTPQHTYQILTKRPERMREYFSLEMEDLGRADLVGGVINDEYGRTPTGDPAHLGDDTWLYLPWPLPNVHLGVTVENQAMTWRIAELLQTPAAVRFVSAEPLLGPVDFQKNEFLNVLRVLSPDTKQLPHYIRPGIDWVICGGESGPGARPMHPDWARSVRDQCVAAGVPFFFKQWGQWTPNENLDRRDMKLLRKKDFLNLLNDDGTGNITTLWYVWKKAAGRMLDGREWNEYPEVVE